MTGLGAMPVALMPSEDTTPILDGGPVSRDPHDEWIRHHQAEQLRRIALATTREIEIPEGVL